MKYRNEFCATQAENLKPFDGKPTYWSNFNGECCM
jgi:hypothetical protein